MGKEFKRNCPECGKVLHYTRNWSKNDAEKKNCRCFSCSNGGKNNPMFGKDSPRGMLGKNHTTKSKNQISQSQIGKIISPEIKRKTSVSTKIAMQRPEVRKKLYESLSKTKYLRVRMDVGQLELLEKWNRLGFHFEPNYEVKTDNSLFFVDGYDKEKNVVLEYDGKYHRHPYQKRKDLVRQQKIIGILHPKRFWRYDVNTKEIRNVLV